MSEIKQICPKCFSEVLRVRSLGEIEVTLDVGDGGEITPSIIGTVKETEADFSQIACACGHICTVEKLAQGRKSTVSNKWYPIEMLVAWDDNGTQMISTQEELDAINAPSVDNMNEDQLREHAKTQGETISSMQEQMAQMMAMMQQLQAGQQAAPQEQPAPTPTTKTKPAPTAKAEPVVETNIPKAGEEFEVVKSGEETGAQDFEVVNVTGDGTEEPGDDLFGDEAPF